MLEQLKATARIVQAEIDKRERMKAMKADAEEDLLQFVRMMWPVMEPKAPMAEGWLLDLLADVMMAVADGHLTRVCVNVPPGSMKSTLLNVCLPAWLWGPRNRPSMRFLSISYSDRVPVRDNLRFAQVIKHPVYQACWGARFKLAREGAEWVQNDQTGWKAVTSVSGSTTGLRGDIVLCLPSHARILTDIGWREIGAIVSEEWPVKVAGFDGQRIVWQRIETYQTNPGSVLIEIAFDGGTLRCTPDHPIWIEGRGYIAARSIREGDTLVGTQALDEHDTLRSVSDAVLSGAGAPRACHPCVLQQGMRERDESRLWQSSLSRWLGSDQMPVVREGEVLQAERGCKSHDVLPFVQTAALVVEDRHAIDAKCLRAMWQCLQTQDADTEPSLLRHGMQERHSCRGDDGSGQRPICSWGGKQRISGRLVENPQGPDQDEGRQCVSALWQDGRSERAQALCSSHRLCEGEHIAGQSYNALSLLPWHDARTTGRASSLVPKIVRSVRTAGYAVRTYNLSVTPHHNYFVEGVLTHNCDDLNNPMDVESPLVRGATRRFVQEVMPSRLNDLATSAIINLQQRTHQDDATGVLLEAEEKRASQGIPTEYTFVCVPAEFDPLRVAEVVLRRDEEDEPLDVWVDPRSLDDDGRTLRGLYTNARGLPDVRMGSPMAKAAGESFWPERFPTEELDRLKSGMTDYAWDSQFNQIPGIRGGAIIRRDWWKSWSEPDYPALGTVVVSLDTAVEEGEANDWNACTAWGAFAGRHGEPQFLLLAAWKVRTNLADLVRMVAETCRERKADYLLIEHKTRGRDVSDEIQRLYQGSSWQTELVIPQGDKVSRLRAISHLFSGDVKRLPDGHDAEGKPKFKMNWTGGVVFAPDKEWAEEVIAQTATFPYSSHDDYVDTVSMALSWCRKTGVVLRKAEYDDQEYERNLYKKPLKTPYTIR